MVGVFTLPAYMSGERRIWLVVNDASGSNEEAARTELRRSCATAGLSIERAVRFPEDPLPGPAELDAAGIDLIAVFTGDGTANAAIGNLAGWAGAVLVLPGGTMNLLYHRLHGSRPAAEVIALAASGGARPVRPGVIRCRQGTALADLLAGPGTSWHDVREAMRDADPRALADSAAHAIGDTLKTAGIICSGPRLGRPEGYPLVMLTPRGDGIRVAGFHAETAGDYLREGWALLRRRFREGPHDDLGAVRQVTLASTGGGPFDILIDGEKARCSDAETFTLVPCEVDLLATQGDGR